VKNEAQRLAPQLACHWSEVVQHIRYNPRWMQEAARIRSTLIVIPKKFGAKRFECLFRMFVRLLS